MNLAPVEKKVDEKKHAHMGEAGHAMPGSGEQPLACSIENSEKRTIGERGSSWTEEHCSAGHPRFIHCIA